MSTSGMFSTSGDIMIHVGDTIGGGYHEYIGGDIMSTSGGIS